MKENLKKYTFCLIMIFIIAIIIGVFMMMYPGISLATLGVIVALFMIVNGLTLIFIDVKMWSYNIPFDGLLHGILRIVLGILLQLIGSVLGHVDVEREMIRHSRHDDVQQDDRRDEQNGQHIDERNTGNRLLANGGYHYRVEYAEGDNEELLYNERNNQFSKFLAGKHHRPPLKMKEIEGARLAHSGHSR